MNLRQFCMVILAAVLWVGAAAPSLGQNAVRPPELNVHYFRAETAWRTGGSVLEAKARVDRVLDELPNDVAARKLRAQVLLTMGRSTAALVDARRAVELNPQDGEAHLILCEAAFMDGDTATAARALDRASALVLEDAGLHIRLSWNAMHLGQLDKAEAFARVALNLDPNEAAAHYQLARVFVLKKQLDEAASVLARGLRASILEPEVIARDTVLARVRGHEELQNLLGQ